MPVPFAKKMWPEPEPHIVLTRGGQLLFRETYKHFKTAKCVELSYDKKENTVTIRPTRKTATRGRYVKGRDYIYTVSNLKKNPLVGCTRFIRDNGLLAPLFSRPIRYRAEWKGKAKGLVVFMDRGEEETGQHNTAIGRAKMGRRTHAKS